MVNLTKSVICQALDFSPVATVIVDLKSHPNKLVYVNQAFEAVSGYDAGELINHSWDELVADSDDEAVADGQLAYLQCHPRLGIAEQICLELLPLYHQPGTPQYWVGTERVLNPADLDEQDSERDALLSVLRDARMHLRRLDGRDSATGILNRRTFDDLLQRDWVMARREQRNLAVLIFRLDDFDGYRDVYGRHAADSCLAKVAHAITGSLRRAGDLSARYSDDQFIVLGGYDDDGNIERLGERIASKVRALTIHHPRSKAGRFVTLSFAAASAVPSASLSAGSFVQQVEQSVGEPPVESPGLSIV
jgi:diguanylate cyclase (GGDEF)-like protein